MKQSADWRSGNTLLPGFSVGKQTLLQVDSDTRSDSLRRVENKIISIEPHERSKVKRRITNLDQLWKSLNFASKVNAIRLKSIASAALKRSGPNENTKRKSQKTSANALSPSKKKTKSYRHQGPFSYYPLNIYTLTHIITYNSNNNNKHNSKHIHNKNNKKEKHTNNACTRFFSICEI